MDIDISLVANNAEYFFAEEIILPSGSESLYSEISNINGKIEKIQEQIKKEKKNDKINELENELESLNNRNEKLLLILKGSSIVSNNIKNLIDFAKN